MAEARRLMIDGKPVIMLALSIPEANQVYFGWKETDDLPGGPKDKYGYVKTKRLVQDAIRETLKSGDEFALGLDVVHGDHDRFSTET